MRKSFAVSIIALTVLTLDACGDQEPGPLTYPQAAQELAKGPESFKAFVNGLYMQDFVGPGNGGH